LRQLLGYCFLTTGSRRLRRVFTPSVGPDYLFLPIIERFMTGHRLVVWYNTRCPVCDAGVNWQRSKLLAAVRAGIVSFQDINFEPAALAGLGVSLDDVRRRLHATDESGRLIVGADVMIAIWRITPSERWLAWLAGNPMILPFTRFAYDRFADLLFAWNRRKGHW
jgi:predicted DCC family thiol-disulfide oxidoreductase YuxK